MMRDALDIVIVNFNTRDVLAACLQSLISAPPDRAHQVVVVDNGSTDGSVEFVRSTFPTVRMEALGENRGFAAANNIGIRATHAPLVLLLNSDTLVGAGAIDRLCERLAETGATAAGPRLLNEDGSPEVSFGRMLSPWSEAVQATRVALASRASSMARRYIARLTSREHNVDWVSGGCLLVRRADAEAVGLLDERYFLYEEDVDFCAALRARGGHILFTPHAEIVHLRGRSVQRTGQSTSRLYDRSHLTFYEKHHPAWAPMLRLWQRLRGR